MTTFIFAKKSKPINTIAFFEIQAENVPEAYTYYQNIFGWNFVNEVNIPNEYNRIETNGINGGLLEQPTKTPQAEFGTNAFAYSIMV